MDAKQLHPEMPLLDASFYLSEAACLAYDLNRPCGDAWCYSRVLNCGDAQGRLLVSAKTNTGVIAIAGTQANSIGDWSINVQTAIYQLKNVFNIHTGFFKEAEQMKQAILATPDLPQCFRTGDYFITGHSLGAAAAAILALLFYLYEDERIDLPKGVVAFGSPKYVTGDSALMWPCPVLHIQSSLDIVSHIPTGFFIREWARAGDQVYINDRGFSKYPGHQIKRFISYIYRAITNRMNLKNIKGIKEHSMDLYDQRVKLGLSMLDSKQELLSHA